VSAQTVPCTHFVVNDGGAPDAVAGDERRQVLHLPTPHRDVGNAARAIGSVSAICQGYDAIAYLDADNWYEPNHIESLVSLCLRTGASVCSSTRTLYGTDDRLLGKCPEVDGVTFVDTNCLFITARAFALVSAWYMVPKHWALMGDRFVFEQIRQLSLTHAHSGLATVGYRTNYRSHYEYFGLEPPPGVKRLRYSADVGVTAEVR